jgi:hypothetical protein
VHIVDEGKIVVSVEIERINLNAEFEVLNCLGVLFRLKVGDSHGVMKLTAVFGFYYFFTSLECFDRLLVILHFI